MVNDINIYTTDHMFYS